MPRKLVGSSVGAVAATVERWAADANALVCSAVMPDGVAASTEHDRGEHQDYSGQRLAT